MLPGLLNATLCGTNSDQELLLPDNTRSQRKGMANMSVGIFKCRDCKKYKYKYKYKYNRLVGSQLHWYMAFGFQKKLVCPETPTCLHVNRWYWIT